MIQADQAFFRYPTAGSIGALTWIRDNTPPNAVLVVQQCQFSAASYFAQRPVMPAMEATDLSSSSELPVTQAALRIFTGSPEFQVDLDTYHVQTVLLDRGCQVPGAVQSPQQLTHLTTGPHPFRPVFDDGDMLVLERS
jgi:hypothetical protein